MLSRAPRRPQRRSGRSALVVAVLAALALTGVLAPAAPAAVRSNAQLALAGSHSFAGVIYAITGSSSITSMQSPQDPCRLFAPVDPCRVINITTFARATNGINSCSFVGSTTVTVPQTPSTTVDAVVVPPNPIIPGNPVSPNDPCAPLGSFAIRYSLAISADNTITAATARPSPSPGSRRCGSSSGPPARGVRRDLTGATPCWDGHSDEAV